MGTKLIPIWHNNEFGPLGAQIDSNVITREKRKEDSNDEDLREPDAEAAEGAESEDTMSDADIDEYSRYLNGWREGPVLKPYEIPYESKWAQDLVAILLVPNMFDLRCAHWGPTWIQSYEKNYMK